MRLYCISDWALGVTVWIDGFELRIGPVCMSVSW